jgi:hypothetical protein
MRGAYFSPGFAHHFVASPFPTQQLLIAAPAKGIGVA